ncbi:MAG: cysteine desulfurase family protein [Thomasclavelia sp.]|nr:cysteine desulfurase family protein [Thomasclavelia sp.]
MIYLDYAATTPLNEDVKNTYFKLLEKYFYNSDSIYKQGLEVDALQEKSRQNLSDMLGCKNNELIFTSCGSEANNLAIKGIAFRYRNRGNHIITTCNEHSSIFEACKELERVFNYEVTYLPVDHNGCVNIEDLKNSIKENTILVSVMQVNNEIGSINNINEIGKYLKQFPTIIFHSDMVQALGKLNIDLKYVDLASFSAHKINGLKGSGLLYKSSHIDIVPLISGGQQEFNLRAGTSNACNNIVFSKTMRLALQDLDKKYQKLTEINDYLRLKLNDLSVVVNSDKDKCIASIINVSLPGYKPEVILHYLESKDILISTRSACSSKTTSVSRVLANMDLKDEVASSAIRISLSYQTSKEDIDTLIKYLKKAMEDLKRVD